MLGCAKSAKSVTAKSVNGDGSLPRIIDDIAGATLFLGRWGDVFMYFPMGQSRSGLMKIISSHFESSWIDNGDPAEGTDSEDHVALSHIRIPSMHVSSMVADARFGRAAACCLHTNP